jgi:SNF2 family DNA or RNA helicase
MLEFAEAGFPSEEDDVVDPRARDRAMNRVVDEIHELNQAENEVLEEAFKLVEKFGLRRKKRDE